jgi:hypothetical protein
MRALLLSISMLSTPLVAAAQSYSNAPMVVVGESAPQPKAADASANAPVTPDSLLATFPKQAITNVGEATGGERVDTPANPASPKPPANPAASNTPANPNAPASPASPVNPVSKLWPRDTVPIFMTACVGFHSQKIRPCSCVITRLMVAMPHDEFLVKSENDTLEKDERLLRIRQDCATAPAKKD